MRRMRKDDTLAKGYQSKIDSYLEQGYARKLSPEETTHQPERTWYLPHFAVYNKEKGKVRLVFDATAKSHAKSLNDFLLTGPNLLTPITQVLYNFRLYDARRPAYVYQMDVMIFGAVCSPTSAQLITVATDIQLHVIAEASEKAYGAAASFRVANHGTQLAVSLVAAKARVAPLKPASIPRLELQAAVLA